MDGGGTLQAWASLESFIAILYGAVGGALVTIIALRTKLALMQRDIRDNARHIEVLEKDIDGRLKMLDRRSIHALRIMADVARKVGVDSRFSDNVIRMLADERGGPEGARAAVPGPDANDDG